MLIRVLAFSFLLLGLSLPAAAQQVCGTISTCPSASVPFSGSETFYVVQGGVSKKITYASIYNQIQSIPVVTKTGNYAVQASDSSVAFDNTGATGTVVFTLPAEIGGLHFCFTNMVSQVLEVLAPNSVHVAIGTFNSAASGNVQTSAAFSTLCIYAPTSSTTQWVTTSTTGTWTVN